MECRKCKGILTTDNVTIDEAAHDPDLLDIVIECPKCGHKTNGFVNTDDFMDLDT